MIRVLKHWKPLLIILLGFACGIAFSYFLDQSSSQVIEKVTIITYDGSHYYTEGYVDAAKHLEEWISKDASYDLRNNVEEVFVYPSGKAGFSVTCVMKHSNETHLEQVSREGHAFLRNYPRRTRPDILPPIDAPYSVKYGRPER